MGLIRKTWHTKATDASVEVWFFDEADLDTAIRTLETAYTAARDELIRRKKST